MKWQGHGVELAPGLDTMESVIHGSIEMVLGLIDRAKHYLPDSEAATVMVTGGDAATLLPHLPGARHKPGLVLDGLGIALPTLGSPD